MKRVSRICYRDRNKTVLKAQLHSKMFQIDPAWKDIEDILTGDFFGTLDYLPRKIFLRDFIAYMISLNPEVRTPCLDGIDWDTVQLLFWPRTYTDEENAEPDVVIVSNKWVLVIEVKLRSGLGDTQPWREYIIGRKIADDYSLPCDSVYYLLVARKRLDISEMFDHHEEKQLNQLLAVTSNLQWHEAFLLVDSWLRFGIDGQNLDAHYRRMLYDLFQAMRRRHVLTFSGFTFEHIRSTCLIHDRVFCPPRFTGFLSNSNRDILSKGNIFLKMEFEGFVSTLRQVNANKSSVFLKNSFGGFIQDARTVCLQSESLFCPPKFSRFLDHSPACTTNKYVFLEIT